MDIARKFGKIAVGFHKDGFKPTLEQMPVLIAFNIRINGVGCIDILHNSGEVWLGCLYKQMIMVAH